MTDYPPTPPGAPPPPPPPSGEPVPEVEPPSKPLVPAQPRPSPPAAHRGRPAVAGLVVVAVVAAAAGAGVSAFLLGRPDSATSRAPAVETSSPGATDTEESGSEIDTPSTSEAVEADAATVFEQTRSGVVRIRASSCEGTGAGTGFLIAGNRVATAAHVVAGSVAISVETDSGTYPATVERIDETADLASLRLAGPDPGHVFGFAPEDPTPGTKVALIGYPLDGPLSISEGTVSGVHRVIPTDAGDRRGLLQTDAALNPGNSGGPVVALSGEVVGLVSGSFPEYEGLGFAVESSTSEPWFASPSSLSPPLAPQCQEPLGPEVTGEIPPPEATTWAEGVSAAFGDYFQGINSGDHETAWRRLSPRLRAGTTLEEFSASVRTSYDYDFVVNDAFYADGRAQVWLEFTSIQDPTLGPAPNQSCTRWSLDYVLVEQPDDRFLIEEARGHGGSSGHEPCL
jgi:S1-C subfamily serine protease